MHVATADRIGADEVVAQRSPVRVLDTSKDIKLKEMGILDLLYSLQTTQVLLVTTLDCATPPR